MRDPHAPLSTVRATDAQLASAARAAVPPLRLRRVTQTRVSAVCVQLGEHVSVRNVHKILGGSLRDIAPKIRAWRAAQAAAGPALAAGDPHQVALGAVLETGLEELAELIAPGLANLTVELRRLRRLVEASTPVADPLLATRLGRIEGQLRSLAERSPAASEAGLTALQAALLARSDRQLTLLDQLGATQAIAAAPIPSALIEALSARLDTSGQQTQTLADQVAAVLGELATVKAQTAAPVDVAPLQAALTTLLGRSDRELQALDALGRPTSIDVAGELEIALVRQQVSVSNVHKTLTAVRTLVRTQGKALQGLTTATTAELAAIAKALRALARSSSRSTGAATKKNTPVRKRAVKKRKALSPATTTRASRTRSTPKKKPKKTAVRVNATKPRATPARSRRKSPATPAARKRRTR